MDTDDELDLERVLMLEEEFQMAPCEADFIGADSGEQAVSLSPGCTNPEYQPVSLSPSGSNRDRHPVSLSPSSSSSDACTLPLAPTLAASSSGSPSRKRGPSRAQAGVQSQEPARKRLNSKTAVPPAPRIEGPHVAEGIWKGYFDRTWSGHRHKYFWVYNKFKIWVRGQIETLTTEQQQDDEKNYVQALNSFRGMEMANKHAVMKEFMDATAAPNELRRWAHTVWPVTATKTEQAQRYFCYAKNVLWTWLGEWGRLELPSVPRGAKWRAVVLLVKEEPAFCRLWEEFCEFHRGLVEDHKVSYWGISAELCVTTWVELEVVRVHLHAYWKSDSKIYVSVGSKVVFKESCPNKSYTCAGLQQRSTAGWAGMYYISCPKVGMVCNEASVAPFTGYPVSGEWVFSLVQARKMETCDARTELVKVGKGIVRKLADLDKLIQTEKDMRIQERVREVQKAIEEEVSSH